MTKKIKRKSLKGNLINVRDRVITGWAYHDEVKKKLEVDIFINGDFIKSVKANQFTPSLKKKHPTGICGFSLQIPKKIALDEIKEIRAFFAGTEFELTNSPIINEAQRYFFLHIPKTAGTSLRYLMYQYFESQCIFPNQYELKDLYNGRYLPFKEMVKNRASWLEPNKQIIIGHYPFKLVNHFPIKPKILTFVRNPIERTISHILHIKKLNAKYKDKSIEEIIKPNGKYNPILKNVQSRILGYKEKKKNIQTLKENIDSIDFIGITEDFQNSIAKCNEKMGWNLENNLIMNTSKTEDKEAFERDLYLEDLMHLNNVDLEAYEYITKAKKNE